MALGRKRPTEPTEPPAPLDRAALIELSRSDAAVVSVRSRDVAELAADHPQNRTFAALAAAFANASPDRRQKLAPATLRELLGIELETEPTRRPAAATE